MWVKGDLHLFVGGGLAKHKAEGRSAENKMKIRFRVQLSEGKNNVYSVPLLLYLANCGHFYMT